MKFVVETVSNGAARCGLLTKSDKVSIKTPGFLHYTRASAVPFLTREVFNYLTHDASNGVVDSQPTSAPPASHPTALGYAISVDSTYHMLEAVRASGAGVAAFASLPQTPATNITCLAVKDAGEKSPSGHHEQDQLPVWTRFGKRSLTAAQYMDYVETYRPDMFMSLCDGDTNTESSRKRALKSADRTEQFLEQCVAKLRKSAVLRDAGSMLLAPIEGGFIARTREVTIKNMQQHHPEIGGYVLDGFHNNGTTAALMPAATQEQLYTLVTECVRLLPADKLRIAFGAYAPPSVLRLCAAGVDLFDNSYAYLATKHACALTFDVRTEDGCAGVDGKSSAAAATAYDLDLRDTSYKMDFGPLHEGCECLACTKHTRAYVHHLVMTNELLASILLMIHNLHHYYRFFEAIRQSVAEQSLAKLTAHIDAQFAAQGSRLHAKFQFDVDNPAQLEKKRRRSIEAEPTAAAASKAEPVAVPVSS